MTEFQPHRLSVAPMMDWTDRHCRFLHRQLSRRVLLYSEMVTAAAVIHGPRQRLLSYDPAEHPVALQLGGSDPAQLAQAVRIAADFGYDEVNLNCGCPSDRVQSGCFGAVLMENAPLVADCVAAMRAAASVVVTVKCRIGVDQQDPEAVLPAFLATVAAAGVQRFQIHARKAWLQGLSPKQNREVPPLDHALVLAMKQHFGGLHLTINGGITSLQQAKALLDQGLDGVMIGRAAYHAPADILLDADRLIYGDASAPSVFEALDAMRPYISSELSRGTRLHSITRHMLGLFAGKPGARGWRRILSTGATSPQAGLEVLDAALAAILQAETKAA